MSAGDLRHTRRWEWAKHAFVLLILASAFFPLYMMLSISTKDNNEFYHNPWYPEPSMDPIEAYYGYWSYPRGNSWEFIAVVPGEHGPFWRSAFE